MEIGKDSLTSVRNILSHDGRGALSPDFTLNEQSRLKSLPKRDTANAQPDMTLMVALIEPIAEHNLTYELKVRGGEAQSDTEYEEEGLELPPVPPISRLIKKSKKESQVLDTDPDSPLEEEEAGED